jgi:hypothetical protein
MNITQNYYERIWKISIPIDMHPSTEVQVEVMAVRQFVSSSLSSVRPSGIPHAHRETDEIVADGLIGIFVKCAETERKAGILEQKPKQIITEKLRDPAARSVQFRFGRLVPQLCRNARILLRISGWLCTPLR